MKVFGVIKMLIIHCKSPHNFKRNILLVDKLLAIRLFPESSCKGHLRKSYVAVFWLLSERKCQALSDQGLHSSMQCEESDPAVFCKYEYTFLTCQDSNVTNCGGDACSTFCSSLGFTAQEDQEGYTCIADSGVVSCQCATAFLTSDGTPESSIYVCGDPGFENDPSGAIVVTTSMGIIGMLVPAVFALLLDL
jgi:hypothetical protein